MEEAGKKLTDSGVEAVKKLDTNGDGKLDMDEMGLSNEGDYIVNNIGQCIGCQIKNCQGAFACHGGYWWKPRPYFWGK